MAASRVFLYRSFLKYLALGRFNLDSDTIVAIPLHDKYTPSTASHSALADIIADQSTASQTIVNTISLANIDVTQSGGNTLKFDADDISGFSSDGSTITSMKYVALYGQSVSGGGPGPDNLLIGFMNLDTTAASSSAGNSTQVNITWSSDGIFKMKGNP
jgi:hypothetical protein